MSQSLSNILVHLVFSTKGRRAFIGQELEDKLWRYLAATYMFGIRGTLITPFQGLNGAADRSPGRCPGLSYHAPSVLRQIAIPEEVRRTGPVKGRYGE